MRAERGSEGVRRMPATGGAEAERRMGTGAVQILGANP